MNTKWHHNEYWLTNEYVKEEEEEKKEIIENFSHATQNAPKTTTTTNKG